MTVGAIVAFAVAVKKAAIAAAIATVADAAIAVIAEAAAIVKILSLDL